MITHQLVLTAVLATRFSWHVEGSQGRAAFNLAMRMDNVDHARLLVPAAKLALLFSDVVEPGACLALLSRTDPDHDSAAASHLCIHRRLLKQGFTGCLLSLNQNDCYLELSHPTVPVCVSLSDRGCIVRCDSQLLASPPR